MAKLTRWEPFREMRLVHDMLDRMMDRSFFEAPLMEGWMGGTIPVDLYQTDDDVIVKATAPGIAPDDLQISVTGDTLTIRGEVKEEHEEEGTQYYVRERRTGSFSRSVKLPTMVNADKAKAEFQHGVLTLTLPKVEEVKPKTITVKAK